MLNLTTLRNHLTTWLVICGTALFLAACNKGPVPSDTAKNVADDNQLDPYSVQVEPSLPNFFEQLNKQDSKILQQFHKDLKIYTNKPILLVENPDDNSKAKDKKNKDADAEPKVYGVQLNLTVINTSKQAIKSFAFKVALFLKNQAYDSAKRVIVEIPVALNLQQDALHPAAAFMPDQKLNFAISYKFADLKTNSTSPKTVRDYDISQYTVDSVLLVMQNLTFASPNVPALILPDFTVSGSNMDTDTPDNESTLNNNDPAANHDNNSSAEPATTPKN